MCGQAHLHRHSARHRGDAPALAIAQQEASGPKPAAAETSSASERTLTVAPTNDGPRRRLRRRRFSLLLGLDRGPEREATGAAGRRGTEKPILMPTIDPEPFCIGSP